MCVKKIMLRLWTVDAFTDTPFCGNPAAICIINKYDDVLCQKIAAEMNLSETAFLVPIYDDENDKNNISSVTNKYHLRWWTPGTEVKFCGHATVAAAHLLFSKGFANNSEPIQFQTKSAGLFMASQPDKSKQEYLMNFPALAITNYDGNKQKIGEILNIKQKSKFIKPIKNVVNAGEDLLVELNNVGLMEKCVPNFGGIKEEFGSYRCIIITAAVNKAYSKNPNDEFDFKSRVFCPTCAINEDPVTGSAHSSLCVYWSDRLNKPDKWLKAYQASSRGGYIKVKYDKTKQRVLMIGSAITVQRVSMMIKTSKL